MKKFAIGFASAFGLFAAAAGGIYLWVKDDLDPNPNGPSYR